MIIISTALANLREQRKLVYINFESTVE